jgi:hypothetical protein
VSCNKHSTIPVPITHWAPRVGWPADDPVMVAIIQNRWGDGFWVPCARGPVFGPVRVPQTRSSNRRLKRRISGLRQSRPVPGPRADAAPPGRSLCGTAGSALRGLSAGLVSLVPDGPNSRRGRGVGTSIEPGERVWCSQPDSGNRTVDQAQHRHQNSHHHECSSEQPEGARIGESCP